MSKHGSKLKVDIGRVRVETEHVSVFEGEHDKKKALVYQLKSKCLSDDEYLVLQYRYQKLMVQPVPDIISVFGVTKKEGFLTIVLEDFHGQPLTNCTNQKPISLEYFFGWAFPVLGAISRLHASRLFHGFLNPNRILYDMDTGEIRLTEFWLPPFITGVSASEKCTDEYAIYVPPEQHEWSSQIVDHRADIYSLGILFYD